MTHGSLFAGIGGFDLGFERAGIRTLWAVEKEPFCRAVLKTHFPGTEIFEDVGDCGKCNLTPVDIISAGFPCQDLSVAGKRRGLAGNRSGLFYELARIMGELEPAWFVLENVPGLFSSNGGRDFLNVLGCLDDLGYGVAWRVLDSQFFGVAQRRRRVFIVGCLGKPCPAEVLFESEGGSGDSAEGREAWQDVTGPLGGGAYGTGRRDEDDPNLAYCLREDPGGIGQGHNTTYAVAGPLNTRNGHSINAEDAAGSHIVAFGLRSSDGHHGHSSPRGDGTDNLVAHALANSGVSSGYRYDPNGEELVACLNSAGNAGGFRTEPGEHLVSSPPHSNGVRDASGLPRGLDSARYRALGNAVTVSVAEWIGRRIVAHEKR